MHLETNFLKVGNLAWSWGVMHWPLSQILHLVIGLTGILRKITMCREPPQFATNTILPVYGYAVKLYTQRNMICILTNHNSSPLDT